MSARTRRAGLILGILALIGGLAAVELTRPGGERRPPVPAAQSPTPTDGASPAPAPGLAGAGPFVVYARASGEVFAFGVTSRQTVFLGRIDGRRVDEPPRQPARGRVIAFPTETGAVWRVSRQGLARVGEVRVEPGWLMSGFAVSPDGRRLATAVEGPTPLLVLVDLRSGRSTLLGRERRSGRYPPEPLVPIAWSLGGSVLYQIPVCRCEDGSPGLYSYDLSTATSSVVPSTRSISLYRFAISPEGQAVVYRTATARRCRGDEAEPCEGPPFFLRRLGAGQARSSVLLRGSDAFFDEVVWSVDGLRLVVELRRPGSGRSRLELVDADTGEELEGALDAVPPDAVPAALLPGDLLVAMVDRTPAGREPSRSLVLLSGGRLVTVATGGIGRPDEPLVLGWLR